MTEYEQAPTCPGCHMGCPLDDVQCVRGQGFAKKWQRGEEIPERRGPGGPGGRPGPGGPGGLGGPGAPNGPGGFSVERRLGFLMQIVPARVKQQGPDDAGRFMMMLARQGGGMSYRVLPEKGRMPEDQLWDVVAMLERSDLLEERGGWVFLTEAGQAEAKWHEDREKQATEEAFSALTDDEKEQLANLLEKLMGRK